MMMRKALLVSALLIASLAASCRRTEPSFTSEVDRVKRDALLPESQLVSEPLPKTLGISSEASWTVKTKLPRERVLNWCAEAKLDGYRRIGDQPECRFVRDSGGDSYYLSLLISGTSPTGTSVTYTLKAIPN